MKHKWNIEFESAGVTYPNGKEALKNINLKIDEGEFVSIIGLSGAGKTTLLKTINKINNITSGEAYIGDRSPEANAQFLKAKKEFLELRDKYLKAKQEKSEDFKVLKTEFQKGKVDYKEVKKNRAYYKLTKLKGKSLREYRTHIGMVFQRYNLIYKSTVLTNVLTAIMPTLPVWRASISLFNQEEKRVALDALSEVNILETAYVRAGDLSGGQMQRVALARTIAQDARVILADEPVGALDPIMAKSVMDSFLKINREHKRTTIMNLHHVELALEYTDRIIGVRDGEIVFDGKAEKVDLKVLKTIYGDKLSGFGKHELDEVWRKRKITHKTKKVTKVRKVASKKVKNA